MKTKQIFYSFILLGTLVWSCKKDDGSTVTVVPPKMLTEVVTDNADEIEAYINTHFYNYEEFLNPPANFDYIIDLDTIAGDNSDKTPLKEQMESLIINVSSSTFSGLEEEDNIPHTMYYLSVRDGVEGNSPTVADSTLLKYEGSLLNGDVFDGTGTYQWQYLPFFLRGYSNAISMLEAGDDIVVNNDGTSTISNSGIGLMIFPSGLAYFNGSPSGSIPQYSSLIFKVNLGLYVEDTDYDNDGIPSIMEDLNGDGNLNNDNTDVESEEDLFSPAFPNHRDPDDDNDGTLTRDEIIIDGNGNITFPDTDGDGIPDYLDPDNS
ncbi:MAG: hypothetical protein COA50_06545 [Flavobacteriaceae bacterium]|nr:MAG: hypothetical protein COA50_06545 [Flavobacteriaceae bacterium]